MGEKLEMEKLFTVLTVIALGFIAIAYPILMLIGIWSYPVYLIILFWLWIIVSVGWICFCGKKKLSEYVVPILIFDVVFTVFFVLESYSNNYGMFGKEDGWIVAFVPTFCVPAICVSGIALLSVITKRKVEKLKIWAHEINERIRKKENAVEQVLSSLYINQSKIERVEAIVALLGACASDKGMFDYYVTCAKAHRKDLYDKLRKINKKYNLKISMKSYLLSDIIKEYKCLKNKLQEQRISESDISAEKYKEIRNRYNNFMKME